MTVFMIFLPSHITNSRIKTKKAELPKVYPSAVQPSYSLKPKDRPILAPFLRRGYLSEKKIISFIYAYQIFKQLKYILPSNSLIILILHFVKSYFNTY